METATEYLNPQILRSPAYSPARVCGRGLDRNGLFISWLSFRHFLTLSKTTNFRLFQIEKVCRRQS